MKDQFHSKGLETTMGYVGWIGTFEGQKGTGKEDMFDSEVVRELCDLGAIPIAKVINLSCLTRKILQTDSTVQTTLTQSLWVSRHSSRLLAVLATTFSVMYSYFHRVLKLMIIFLDTSGIRWISASHLGVHQEVHTYGQHHH
jgi:hypothetical protein